jgi:P4 family phage/plasmid primase-like protien
MATDTKYKDPAEFILHEGINPLQQLFEQSVPAERYVADQLIHEYEDRETLPDLIIDELISTACGTLAEAGLSNSDLFWARLTAFIGGRSDKTEADIRSIRLKHDQKLAGQEGEATAEQFIKEVLALGEKKDQQAHIREAMYDSDLIRQLAEVEIAKSGRLEAVFRPVRAVYGLGTYIDQLRKSCEQLATDLRLERMQQQNQVLESDSHVVLARRVVECMTGMGTRPVVFAEGCFYYYDDNIGCWAGYPQEKIPPLAHDLDGLPFVKETAKGPRIQTLALKNDTIKGTLKVATMLREVAKPSFFGDARRGVQLQNGLLVIGDDGELELLDPDPDHRQRFALPFGWDPDAPAPMFDQAFHDWFKGDDDAEKKAQLLLEFGGAALFGMATEYQRCVMLYGPGGTGKSVFLKILMSIFPPESVAAIDPQDMANDYKLALMAGKLLNVGFDIQRKAIEDTAGLKKLVTGDTITARHIYDAPFSYRPVAGHAFAANERPRSRDHSNAFFDRIILIGFHRDFRNDPLIRIPNLAEKIVAHERPGVIARLVRAAQRLVERGRYDIPASSRALNKQWRHDNDAIQTWLQVNLDKVVYRRGAIANVDQLYQAFRFWARDHGFYPPNVNTFRDRLETEVHPVDVWYAKHMETVDVGPGQEPQSIAKAQGISASECRDRYHAWATGSGLPALNSTRFGRRLGQLAEKVKSGSMYYLARPTKEQQPIVVDTPPASRSPRACAIDCETTLATEKEPVPRLICLAFYDEDGDADVIAPDDGVQHVRELLEANSVIVGHNIAFDFEVLVRHADDPDFEALVWHAYEDGQIRDTMITEALIRNAEGRLRTSKIGLAKLSEAYLGRKICSTKTSADSWRRRYEELEKTPIADWPADALRYAVDDARIAMDVHRAQTQKHPDLADTEAQIKHSWALQLLGHAGVHVDHTRTQELIDTLDRELRAGKADLSFYREDDTLNTTSVRDAVERLHPDPPTTSTGLVQMGNAVLRETGNSELERLADLKEMEKQRGTFGKIFEGLDGLPVRCTYDVVKRTGRTSCSKPNIQQLPRDGGIRECFVPRPGHVFVAADYATLELRALAQVCLDLFGESTMADLLRDGADLHLDMAAKIRGISYEEAVQRYAEQDPEIKETRQLAKAANFGFPGGLGANTFLRYAEGQWGLTLTPGEAQALKLTWRRQFPEVRRYFDRINRQLDANRRMNLTQLRSGRVRGDVSYTAACNSYFQGLAADGAKEALWRVSRGCYVDTNSDLYGCLPLVFLHDEIILDVPEEQLAESAEALEQTMIEGMQVFVPDIPIEVEAVAMRRWSKDARRITDQDGNLIAWPDDGEDL